MAALSSWSLVGVAGHSGEGFCADIVDLVPVSCCGGQGRDSGQGISYGIGSARDIFDIHIVPTESEHESL